MKLVLQPILPSVTTRLTQYQIPGVPPADCVPKSNFTTSQTLNGTVNISYGGTNYRMVSIMAKFPSGVSMDIKIAGGEEIVNLTNTFSGCYPGFSANQTVRGLPAKLEYLFGGTSAASPPADHLPTFSNVGANVRLSFVRRTDDSTLNHVVELNYDLASGVWQQVSTQPATESAGMDLQRWTYDIPTDGAARSFYRIRAW